MEVSVVGAGTVGSALAVLLGRAGHHVAAVAGRTATPDRVAQHVPGVPVLSPTAAASAGEVVLITTPDDVIEPVCRRIADGGGFRSGQIVAHCSGAAGLDLLGPAVDAGARPLCLHPLQTFPDVDAALRTLPGATIAVTATDDDVAELGDRLAREIGGVPVRVSEDRKPLYHAAAVVASGDLVALLHLARDLFEEAGVEQPLARLLPLSRATLENVERLGPERAVTGPVVRGDSSTIERNLEALREAAPRAIPIYVALARLAVELAERSGRLDGPGRTRIQDVLDRWS